MRAQRSVFDHPLELRGPLPANGGVVLFPKPPGPTSHDVVEAVRRVLPGRTRVGHAGTLDPFAEGLLLILVGRATRAQRWFMELPKTYRAVARLGWRSDTGDPEGSLERTGRVPPKLALPTGRIMQVPPAYSAVKVGGERAYRLARRGETPRLKPRPVEVYRAELVDADGERAEFEIVCSSGTYVRQLVASLGDAYCERLVRTAIGPFRLEDADPGRVVPLEEALSFLPAVQLSPIEARRVEHGGVVKREQRTSGPVRLLEGDRLVAIGEPRDATLRPAVVFPRER
ncbi:tRNA pseudouridine(55) synthase TruB [Thermoleophilum album]|uniref:tRNA pseudouridine synthase B n=1 Tax=Thermoleophilum album TaxID=29539 RepID=A0A1H6FU59_THEAL|nr:tRNA pseudouridine(55) synthase TruB [Thermoleophilum album]SEH14361.1 tRNA pseudouridine55 synthase [Thermoleophilum album]